MGRATGPPDEPDHGQHRSIRADNFALDVGCRVGPPANALAFGGCGFHGRETFVSTLTLIPASAILTASSNPFPTLALTSPRDFSISLAISYFIFFFII